MIEILSPATAADDLTEKLDTYRSIPGLETYLVIDSRRRLMHHYERLEDGRFATAGRIDSLFFATIGVTLAVEDVYRNTSVPELSRADLPALGDDPAYVPLKSASMKSTTI